MRSARGNVYGCSGVFHLETQLKEDLPLFKLSEAAVYEKWLLGLGKIYGFDPLFWLFHAKGFSFIVETSPSGALSNERLADGFAQIEENRLSAHLQAPSAQPLSRTDAIRLEGFIASQMNLMEFAKGLKQRISRHYNQARDRRGTIWNDRIGIHPLPRRAQDLTEVAAFIMAGPQLNGMKHTDSWPGSLRSADQGDPIAVSGLQRIFQKKSTTARVLRALKQQSIDIVQIARTNTPDARTRGRKPAWRPNCETASYLDNNIKQKAPSSRQEAKHRKKQFIAMFERFQKFKKRTGLKSIPYGWDGDPELRKWASRQRGLYYSGRLPAWKVEFLEGSGVLDRPPTGGHVRSIDGTWVISEAWMERYNELKSYHETHGHSKVPRTDSIRPKLANWVWTQRSMRRKSKLSTEQIKLLDGLDFFWNDAT